MSQAKSYFFSGVGGSGMLPLALILRGKGETVAGSDRSLDQGRLGAKFEYLKAHGIALFPQDGSGVVSANQILVRSAAVEDTVGDVVAAKAVGARDMKRPELLAELFNSARVRIGVAGTSGKSTTTGMIAWLLHQAGRDPTVMNGAVMKNFVTPEALFSSALVGKGDAFVSEVDESDGSIARYEPTIAVVNNIALDHKSMDELRDLFAGFVNKAEIAVLNMDNDETGALVIRTKVRTRTYALRSTFADLHCTAIRLAPDGVSFDVMERESRERATVELAVPGEHNVSNALAALSAARAYGLTLKEAAEALKGFSGTKRRLEVVGNAAGVIVIDDFGHNPDKITATLSALHAFPGRLLIMFQPHGFGPLRLMRQEFIDTFATHMGGDDVLIMPDPVYFGGTVDRSVTSEHIVSGVRARGLQAMAFAERAACGDKLIELAEPGDRIVVMGARDDTLSVFAADLLQRLAQRG
jgi:UDP-N-acetylmuramate--alanine ligase